jgi:hypothetical protein
MHAQFPCGRLKLQTVNAGPDQLGKLGEEPKVSIALKLALMSLPSAKKNVKRKFRASLTTNRTSAVSLEKLDLHLRG